MIIDARLRSNIYALYLVQGLNYLLSLVTLPFLTRVLEPQSFGVMNYAFAAVTYGVLVTDFGFNFSAVRDLAHVRHDPQAAARVFWKVTWAKTLLMVVSCVALMVLTLLFGSWRMHASVFFCSLLYIVSSVFFPIWYFQAYEEMRFSAALMVLSRALMLGLLLTLVNGPDDLALAVILQATPQILAGALWWYSGWGLPRPRWAVTRWPELTAALRASWPFFLSAISTNLYTTSTNLLLGFFALPQQVGYFSAANKLTYTVQGALLGALVQATYPRIAQLAAHDQQGAYALIRKAAMLQGGAGLATTLLLIVTAPWVVPLIMGKAMVGAVAVQAWLSVVIVLGALSYVLGQQSLLPFGHERYYSRVLITAGLLNVALLCVFLPGCNDAAVRAAQCVVAVELYIVAAFWWRARRVYAQIRP